MSLSDEKLEIQLEQLIIEKKSFAIYHLPSQKEISFIAQQEDTPQEFLHLSELNNKKGFIISPFNVTTSHPIVLIRPDIEISGLSNIIGSLDKLPFLDKVKTSAKSIEFREQDIEKEYIIYKDCFNRFISSVKEERFAKLVLSRSHKINRPLEYSTIKSFFNAVEAYPHMMSYFCYTPQTGIWIGSTPEIILSGERHQWHTVALAGTMPIDSVSLSVNGWDKKNIEEQNVVSEYIHNIISSYTRDLKEEGPYTAQAGNVVHLKTDFRFTLDNNKRIGELLDELHPTPAVCGFPKKEAFEFIIQNEAHDRKYYSGIIGKLDTENITELYVNLRCAEIDDSSITLYAGGGIMPTSVAKSEWNETDHKMQTLLNII